MDETASIASGSLITADEMNGTNSDGKSSAALMTS